MAATPLTFLIWSFGGTPFEALQEVEKAKAAWLADAKAARKPVPKPRYCPAIYQLVPA